MEFNTLEVICIFRSSIRHGSYVLNLLQMRWPLKKILQRFFKLSFH